MRNNKPSAWRDILEILAFFAVCALLIWLILMAIKAVAGYVRAEAADGQLRVDTVSEECGVGRATGYLNGVLLLGGETNVPVRSTALRVYTEGVDNPMPEWWNPDEPMAVEWYAEDHFVEADEMVDNDHFAGTGNMVEAEPHPPVGVSLGGVDWNIETEIIGWDGHSMTVMELNLFARVFYLEFFGASVPCCEAGCDAILNLWASGIYGRTLFEALSYCDPQYGYTYEVYPWVWTSEFDAEGLEWCREFCLERFVNGPEWVDVMYFQLYRFHDTSWTIPLFECDGVYFSKGK